MWKISSNSFIIEKKATFYLWQWNFGIVFWKQSLFWAIKNQISILMLCFWVLESCPDELYKDCHRQTSKQSVWTHRLVITSQSKQAIFPYRKRWVVSMGLKRHEILWKGISASIIIIHSFHAVLWGLAHVSDLKKWHSNTVRSGFKWHKIHFLPFSFSCFTWQ